MAQRRMFSLKVIDTDDFLEMPQSSQYLYYNFAMRADDDGFVANPKKILRMVNCNNDDFKILCAKKYLIPFESGICVIRHWRIHNYIQKDRYEETQYLSEKEKLVNIKGKYEMDKKCIQNVSKMDTQVRLGKVRLGKVRLGKVKKEEIPSETAVSIEEPENKKIKTHKNAAAETAADPNVNSFINLFQSVNPSYEVLFQNKNERAAAARLLKKFGWEWCQNLLQKLPVIVSRKYAPRITTPYQLEKDLGKLKIFLEQERSPKKEGVLEV